jgi:cytochrome c-type biogenesis protein CcmE
MSVLTVVVVAATMTMAIAANLRKTSDFFYEGTVMARGKQSLEKRFVSLLKNAHAHFSPLHLSTS